MAVDREIDRVSKSIWGPDRQRQFRTRTRAPQRLRLVRFTAAQRHAAQLISGELTVPASTGAVQIEKTLRLLAAHFQIHANSAQAARQVDSDSRLHAARY